MCDQQSLRSACTYAQSDQNLCLLLEYSLAVKLLTEHHLECLSLKEAHLSLHMSKYYSVGKHMSLLSKVNMLSLLSIRGRLLVGLVLAFIIHMFLTYSVDNRALNHVMQASSSSWLQEHMTDISER